MSLQQKAPHNRVWLEYNTQFHIQAAASEDKSWPSGDSWQYVSCLQGGSIAHNSLKVTAGQVSMQQAAELAEPLQPTAPKQGGRDPMEVRTHGKEKGPADGGPAPKKPKRPGTCRLINKAPGGCPYGTSCIFVYRCTGCSVPDEHGALACPHPNRVLPGRR